MDLRKIYKDEKCPYCREPLIFNNDYTKAACKDCKCTFNKPIEFYYK